ncbi:UNVERIFIED_CONTAM: hypothetical protein PYX00_003026 [Menopon gallinae]|uniref:DNA-directed RNA polymerase n=1 Tax=Menopon gallinae TaxID=328185 RepID=A0AAW2HYS4_9NEOP
MNQLFRVPFSSIYTSCSVPTKYYEGTYIRVQRVEHGKVLKNAEMQYSSFKQAVFKSKRITAKRNNKHSKLKETELLKVTQSHTTETTMQIGKLNASHVTAFAEEPGMILKNINKAKESKVPGDSAALKPYEMQYINEKFKNCVSCRSITGDEYTINKGSRRMQLLHPFNMKLQAETTNPNLLPLLKYVIKGKSKGVLEKDLLANEDYEDTKVFIGDGNTENTYDELNRFLLDFNTTDPEIIEKDDESMIMLSFIYMCTHCGLVDEAISVLMGSTRRELHADAFNILIRVLAQKGDLGRINKLINRMKTRGIEANSETYALYLYCLSKTEMANNSENVNKGIELNDLFQNTQLSSEERESILKLIRHVSPFFEIAPHIANLQSSCPLTAEIYKKNSNMKAPLPNFSKEQIRKCVEEQLMMERDVTVKIKSVLNEDGGGTENKNWIHLRKFWSDKLEDAFDKQYKILEREFGLTNSISSIYPYIRSLPRSMFLDIMLMEIQNLILSSATYSPNTFTLYIRLGERVWNRYFANTKTSDPENLKKMSDIIEAYCNNYANPTRPACNLRQNWQFLVGDCPDAKPLTEKCIVWPESIKRRIGKFLYGIIFKGTLIPDTSRNNLRVTSDVPGLYIVLRYKLGKLTEEVKFHPKLLKYFDQSNIRDLLFDVEQLPMVCPPKPWSEVHSGGYLFLHTNFVRFTSMNYSSKFYDKVPTESFYDIFDGLNALQSIPWVINTKVLDTAIELFKAGGSKKVNVPVYPSRTETPKMRAPGTRVSKADYLKHMKLLQETRDAYGLWCEALYKLSLANHYRDKIFWLPQNIDFRGRVYPVPPHVSHVTADLYRSLLLFAKKEPLGKKGLDWLKIHAVNLKGTHKKCSLEDKLRYANEILPEIMDSAMNPLTGRMWWTESEEPWQTLAVCIEICNAIESGDPENYKSNFPVHQDGSCNGLQHYAALGRDELGAASVNLTPKNVPQDVYGVVVGIVEKLRQNDAKRGLEIAKKLEGFVTRKVIKQTVMTTVYGVTKYGATLQISKQLEDIEGFPKELVGEAAFYLASQVFRGLEEMFTSAKGIQDWLVNCSRVITNCYRDTVSWITPLGLPVVQPYFKVKGFKGTVDPDPRKQANAFPPNFIHSLDSSHMMLTALNCERAGITFAAVHDCFWTHPSTVDALNVICREQFVALHSQDILKSLSTYFISRYHQRKQLPKTTPKLGLNVLRAVPKTGNLDLKQVLNSVYFFS